MGRYVNERSKAATAALASMCGSGHHDAEFAIIVEGLPCARCFHNNAMRNLLWVAPFYRCRNWKSEVTLLVQVHPIFLSPFSNCKASLSSSLWPLPQLSGAGTRAGWARCQIPSSGFGHQSYPLHLLLAKPQSMSKDLEALTFLFAVIRF